MDNFSLFICLIITLVLRLVKVMGGMIIVYNNNKENEVENEVEIIKKDDETVESTGRQRDGANQKIILFIIGVLVGAVISTGAFLVYIKVAGVGGSSDSSMQGGPGGTPPEMPGGSSNSNGQPPEMPSGSSSSNGQPPEMPSGSSSSNSSNGQSGTPPEMPGNSNSNSSNSGNS